MRAHVPFLMCLPLFLFPGSASATEIDGITSRAAVAGPAFESTLSYAFMNLDTVAVGGVCSAIEFAPTVSIRASDGSSITCTDSLGAPVVGYGTCRVLRRTLSYAFYSREISRPAFASGGWAFVTVNFGTDAAPDYRVFASQHVGVSTCSGWGAWTEIAAPPISAGDGLTAPSAVTVGATTYLFVADNSVLGYGGIYYTSNTSGAWPTSSSQWSMTPSVQAGNVNSDALIGVPVATYSGGLIHILEVGSGSEGKYIYYDWASVAPDGTLAFAEPDPNTIWDAIWFTPVGVSLGQILSACTLRDYNPSGSASGLQVVCQDQSTGRYYYQNLASLAGVSSSTQRTREWYGLGGPSMNNPLAPTSTIANGTTQRAVLLANSLTGSSPANALYVAAEQPYVNRFTGSSGYAWTAFSSPLSF